MNIKLLEFKNQNNEILRGILTLPDGEIRSGVIFVHGFERNATVEKKFRLTANELAKQGIASLRFDASGCGLSEGDFSDTTIAKRSQEMMAAVDFFKNEVGDIKIDLFAHSLGACLVAARLEELKPIASKIVLVAPALNQRDLLRFYFARDLMKIKDPGIAVSWNNYKQYLDEELFQKNCDQANAMLKENFIGSNYFMEAKSVDFSRSFDGIKEKVLHIHGDADPKVPLESLGSIFPNRIIVPGGDHDLERPDWWCQWFSKAAEFITGGN